MMMRPADVLKLTAGQVMTPNPLTVRRDALAVEALRIMETHKITSVVVVDADRNLEGVVHFHDLWRTQMI
jgi:arabinose-5-phosphate isomerase